MAHVFPLESRSARRGALLLAGLLVAIASFFCIKSAPASASYENFCSQVLAPWGQPGDRCRGLGHFALYGVNLQTYERAGCADYENSSSELIQPWTCISSHNIARLDVANQTVVLRGVARNNNVNNSGFFGASEFW